MKALKKILADKSTNHTVVAIIIGFGTANFVMSMVQWWNSGPVDYWKGQIIRSLIAFVLLLIIAEVIAGQSK